MNIGLVDVDGHNFPNLALMKISAWHKENGDSVEWYDPLFGEYEKIHASKVFTFTPDFIDYNPKHPDPIKGGTGYRMYGNLPDEIDAMLPDYSIYPQYDFAIGFLSRGCIRNCPWCVVPKKEGGLRRYDDIERISQGRKHVVLMDNNFLANDPEFVSEQLTKARELNLNIDFNQGLDARLVTEENAKLLASVKWKGSCKTNSYIRFSCDTQAMIPHLQNAVSMLRKSGYKGGIFVYVLSRDLKESHDRIMRILEMDNKISPFCMPYRNLDGDGQVEDDNVKRLARWCNFVAIRKSCKFEDYK